MDERTFPLRLVQWNVMPGDPEEKEYFMSVYPALLDTKFHALMALYLESTEQQQRDLTNFFAAGASVSPVYAMNTRFDNIIIYMRRVARSLRSAADRSLLCLGLAAATLTEGQVDSHDLLVSLAFLYHSASRAGIDPIPDFDKMASTAGKQVQKVLLAFLCCDALTIRRIVQHYEGTC